MLQSEVLNHGSMNSMGYPTHRDGFPHPSRSDRDEKESQVPPYPGLLHPLLSLKTTRIHARNGARIPANAAERDRRRRLHYARSRGTR
jgi:hypothetical protein